MKWTYTLPDHFISVSHWVAKSMQDKLHIPPEKISVVYDGIPLEKLNLNANGTEFRRAYNIPDEVFAVGLVGLLMPWKGQALFLEAAKLLLHKIPQLKMLIVGGTPDDFVPSAAMLRHRVNTEKLTELVIFTGQVSEMETVYNGLNIVVSASTDPEPLGTVVIEAMAMCRLLIAPNHGGAAEMILHDETGLLFTPRDAQSLAAAIEKFYRSKMLRTTLGANARSSALKVFAIESHVARIQNIYQQLLEKSLSNLPFSFNRLTCRRKIICNTTCTLSFRHNSNRPELLQVDIDNVVAETMADLQAIIVEGGLNPTENEYTLT
jgi:glycosyltransferase involved in cell wall biosynthesis